MSIAEQLHKTIDELSEEQQQKLLEVVNQLLEKSTTEKDSPEYQVLLKELLIKRYEHYKAHPETGVSGEEASRRIRLNMDGVNKFSIVFTEQADLDRDRIIDELIARKPALGRQWLDAYEYTELLIPNNPYLYQEHLLFVRRAHLRKFPYTVYYVVDEINSIILTTAILHQKQDPAIILERLNIEF